MKKDVNTLEECLEIVDKLHKKLGDSAYHMIHSAISDKIQDRDSYWEIVEQISKDKIRNVYKCNVCGKISAAPVRYCSGCGGCKVDKSGNIKKR